MLIWIIAVSKIYSLDAHMVVINTEGYDQIAVATAKLYFKLVKYSYS